MEKRKVILIGSGNGLSDAVKKLEEEGNEVQVIDDVKNAKDILKGEYYKETVYKYESIKPYIPVERMTKREINAPIAEPVRTEPKIQNNESCPCGSGKKYKKCCK